MRALSGRLAPFISRDDWLGPPVVPNKDDPLLYPNFLANALEDMDILLHTLTTAMGMIELEEIDAYEKAADAVVSNVYLVPQAYGSITTETEIITLLHKVPQRFRDLLESKDPLALCILARNFALLSLMEDSAAWWIHGAGQRKVPLKAVRGLRALLPPEYQWAMEWPMRVISKEISLM